VIELDLSEHYEAMLEDLRDEVGDEIDQHLREQVAAEIHESYQQLRRE
jgi:hypothetical protein